MTFGEYFAHLRREREVTLRAFAIEHGFDAGNLSKMERGKLPPPKSERVVEYAAALGIQDGTEEYDRLRDLAAVGRGEIPPDLLADPDVMAQLPVLFRTLRGEPVDIDLLRSFAERIRES